jgi:hypothetical protein
VNSEEDNIAPILNEANMLFIKKNEGYGSAWRELGLKGLYASSFHSKLVLLKKGMWDDDMPKGWDEKLRDVLLDIIICAAMAILYIDERRK